MAGGPPAVIPIANAYDVTVRDDPHDPDRVTVTVAPRAHARAGWEGSAYIFENLIFNDKMAYAHTRILQNAADAQHPVASANIKKDGNTESSHPYPDISVESVGAMAMELARQLPDEDTLGDMIALKREQDSRKKMQERSERDVREAKQTGVAISPYYIEVTDFLDAEGVILTDKQKVALFRRMEEVKLTGRPSRFRDKPSIDQLSGDDSDDDLGRG